MCKILFSSSVAPLEEVDYTSHDQIAHMNGDVVNGGASSHEGLNGHHGSGSQGPDSMTSADLHRQLLNIPMTSEGSNHDSHNDSGYSTRLGFSAGPSPSLSGMCYRAKKVKNITRWSWSSRLVTTKVSVQPVQKHDINHDGHFIMLKN